MSAVEYNLISVKFSFRIKSWLQWQSLQKNVYESNMADERNAKLNTIVFGHYLAVYSPTCM